MPPSNVRNLRIRPAEVDVNLPLQIATLDASFGREADRAPRAGNDGYAAMVAIQRGRADSPNRTYNRKRL
jgi:hypothetical protein